MQENIHALELGGTLFVPASHKSLEAILSGEKYPNLRSVVIDFEDGLTSKDRAQALKYFNTVLQNLKENRLLRFIRPQDQQMLKALLQQKDIEKIDGFILPKFGLDNASEYLSIVQHFNFMPSIEGKELFNIQELQKLREVLTPYQDQIICIRFGAQDMLRQLGLKQTHSIYDMLVPRQIIANLIATFKPYNFEISAPVYPNFSNVTGLEEEVTFELQNRFLSKTIIHPKQIEPINKQYQVTQKEFEEAQHILKHDDGVVNLDGKMGEVKTQATWAKQLSIRAEHYGFHLQEEVH